MKIIIAALEIEVMFLLKKMRQTHTSHEGPLKKYYGEIRGVRLLIVITGVGKQYARAGIQRIFMTEKPSAFLSIGYGGGLSPDLKLGDLCFIRKVAGPGAEIHFEEDNIFGVPEITLHTAEEVIRFPEEKLLLYHQFQRHIVEMETYYLAEEVLPKAIPLTCLRVVLDTQQEPLREYGFFSPTGELFVGKLLKFLIQQPHRIWELRRMQKKGALASRKIAEVAIHWLEHSL